MRTEFETLTALDERLLEPDVLSNLGPELLPLLTLRAKLIDHLVQQSLDSPTQEMAAALANAWETGVQLEGRLGPIRNRLGGELLRLRRFTAGDD